MLIKKPLYYNHVSFKIHMISRKKKDSFTSKKKKGFTEPFFKNPKPLLLFIVNCRTFPFSSIPARRC